MSKPPHNDVNPNDEGFSPQDHCGFLVIINDEHAEYYSDLKTLVAFHDPAGCFEWHYAETLDALKAKILSIYAVLDLEELYHYAKDHSDEEAESLYWALLHVEHDGPVALRSGHHGTMIDEEEIANQRVDDSIGELDKCRVFIPVRDSAGIAQRVAELEAMVDRKAADALDLAEASADPENDEEVKEAARQLFSLTAVRDHARALYSHFPLEAA